MSKARELAELIGNAGGTSEQVLSGRRNLIINGGFDVWQRNTNSNGFGYLSDRWLMQNINTAYQSTDVPSGSGFKYCIGFGNTSTATYPLAGQRIEASTARHLVSNSITISFWAKNVSGTAQMFIELAYPSAEDNWGSYSNFVTEQQGVATSEWSKYTLTVDNVPSQVTNGLDLKIGLQAQSVGELKITGVQLELGSTATPFEHRSYGEELALCQRYCQAYTNPPVRGVTAGSRVNRVGMPLPVEMRTSPSITVIQTGSSNHMPFYDGTTTFILTSIQTNYTYPTSLEMDVNVNGTWAVDGRAACGYKSGVYESKVILDAEL